MKLVGLMPCRAEAWVLGFSLRVALMWCDEVIICDHQNEDEDRDIMNQVADETKRLRIIEDRQMDWQEMPQRQMLLEAARERSATHVAICDADEVLTADLITEEFTPERAFIKLGINGLNCDEILSLPGYNLRGGLNRYHSSGIWARRWFSTAFADRPDLHWGGDTFHQRQPFGDGAYRLNPYEPIKQGEGGILHLWGCSERRLRAKHAMYKITERLRWPNKPIIQIEQTYNLWRSPEDAEVMYPGQQDWGKPWTLADVPAAWLAPYAHLMPYLDIDAIPYQEQAVRDTVAKHGAEMFQGLDLFGIA